MNVKANQPASDGSPMVLDRLLGDFVRRRRRLRATGVSCLAIAFAVLWLLAGAVIDRLLALPVGVRVTTLSLLLLLIGLAIYRAVQLIFGKRFDKLIAARQIEAMTPSLRDRLITVVTQQSLPPRQRASEGLTQLLTEDVTQQLAKRPPERLIHNRHIAPAVVLLSASGVALVLMSLIPWLGLPKLIARQVLPLADIPPVTTTRINVLTGSLDLPQGQSLAIVADIARGSGEATLLVGDDDASLQPVAMARTFADRFAVTLPAVERDTIYRVRSGDALSPAYQLRVLTRPILKNIRARLEFPSYIQREALLFDSTDGLIEAVRNTRATLRLHSTEPLADALVILGDVTVATSPTIDPYVREVTFDITQSADMSVTMTSTRGVSGSGPKQMRVTCVDDRPPIVQFVRTDLRLHPSDVAAIPFQVIDDFGTDRLSLTVQSANKVLLERDLPLGSERRMIRDVATVDLAPLALAYGDVVTLTLTAIDGAGQVRSGTPCQVLLSPRSVDPRVLRRIDAIGEALQYAQTIASQPTDSAMALRALLRALATSDEPELSDYLQLQIDRAQQITSAQVWGLSRLDDADRALAKVLVESLQILHRGQQARLLQAELENIRVTEATKKDLSKPERDALRQSLARAKAELASRLQRIDIDASEKEIDRRLAVLIVAEDRRYESDPALTIRQIAQVWQRNEQPLVQRDRVAIAAQAEVLRSDSDLGWARDLQIIARAMVRLTERGQSPAELPDAVDAIESLHNAWRTKPKERLQLIPAADQARKQLRLWAGEGRESSEVASRPLDQVLAEPAKLQTDHDLAMARIEDQAEPNDGPEVWQPPSEKNADGTPNPLAQQLSSIAQQQRRLEKKTEIATDQAVSTLASGQQQIAAAIAEVETQQMEDFFEPDDTVRKQEALDALRSAQRALADLPQQLSDLRKQAEALATLKQQAERAQQALNSASPVDRDAVRRTSEEANRQYAAGADHLNQEASGVASDTRAALKMSASRLGAIGSSMSAGDQQLTSAIDSLHKRLSDADLNAADKDQAKVLDAVADLQASLRVAQKKLIERDPVVAARFFAERAAEALRQTPPDRPAIRAYQQQTGQALRSAWDAALAKTVEEKLASMPAFQGVQFDDLRFDASGATDAAGISLDRTIAPEWGRLRDKRDTPVTNASQTPFVPAGYEKHLRLYFQTLDQARSTSVKPD